MSYSELDPLTANTRLAEFRIVDVREAHEFAGPLGKIAGAELVALGTVRARADELRGSRPLLLVCRSGARSGKARGGALASMPGRCQPTNRRNRIAIRARGRRGLRPSRLSVEGHWPQ